MNGAIETREILNNDTDTLKSEEDIVKTKEIILNLNEYQELKKKVSIKELVFLFIKRFFDIICGIIGVALLIPIALILKIITICTGDFHSIFFSQNRIGKNGKEFKLYKFRSMIINADEVLFKTLEMDKVLALEYKKNKKLKNDPRITKVGKIIRKLSIDELPQLINVLKGDMSLIGNRPYLPREKDDMGNFYKEIIKTKPGITGYWQVNGRSKTTFKERLELESYYSKHYSLLLDIKIFFKTFKVVLGGKDAE